MRQILALFALYSTTISSSSFCQTQDAKSRGIYELAHLQYEMTPREVLTVLKRDNWTIEALKKSLTFNQRVEKKCTVTCYGEGDGVEQIRAVRNSERLSIEFLNVSSGDFVDTVEYKVRDNAYSFSDLVKPIIARYGQPCSKDGHLLLYQYTWIADLHGCEIAFRNVEGRLHPERHIPQVRVYAADITGYSYPDGGGVLTLSGDGTLLDRSRRELPQAIRDRALSEHPAPAP